ncbi:glutamate-rich protein 6 isoform X2 [Hoplias malabaricus]|uniref:glutamate-rich protein 6 isoform X2 n=1 Tax=Hoplias malabaricus TaxID=27720 RepID=UPI00346318EC
MEQHYKQILEAPLDPSHGLHGVLRYRREPLERRVSLQPQISTDQSAWCEFCGTAAKPPLYQVHREGLEDFCCVRYREVFEEVTQETRFVLKLTEERPSETVKSEELKSTVENELELGVGEWDSEEHRAQQKEMERFYKEAQARLSSENSFYNTKTISFQLSSCVPVEGISAVKKESRKEEKPEFCEWKNSFGSGPAGFGLHHHQDACFIQKCYPNGNKFLTAFPDGSAQVFYPSGNLAVILLINEKEKVCVVHDDITHQSPIRALFQSNGRATCYHGNGGVWLNMDMFGGRSLDKGGAKTRSRKMTTVLIKVRLCLKRSSS